MKFESKYDVGDMVYVMPDFDGDAPEGPYMIECVCAESYGRRRTQISYWLDGMENQEMPIMECFLCKDVELTKEELE